MIERRRTLVEFAYDRYAKQPQKPRADDLVQAESKVGTDVRQIEAAMVSQAREPPGSMGPAPGGDETPHDERVMPHSGPGRVLERDAFVDASQSRVLDTRRSLTGLKAQHEHVITSLDKCSRQEPHATRPRHAVRKAQVCAEDDDVEGLTEFAMS